jgi:hypothetical protein
LGISYTAVVLQPADQEKLFFIFDTLFECYLTQAGFSKHTSRGQRLADHMTLNMGKCRDRKLVGTKVPLKIDAWAVDHKVMAVRVVDDGSFQCENKTPHITMFVNHTLGGVPRNSNGLTNWIPLATPIEVSGVVSEV